MAGVTKTYKQYADSVSFWVVKGTYEVYSSHPHLSICGAGRSAAVFKLPEENRVIKVYYPPFESVAKQEYINYMKITDHPQYASLYEVGTNYIVLEYIKGKTAFQCLHEGIHISLDQIKQVDDALGYARTQGLYPSDIHLHNLLITSDGLVRIIDIARFSNPKPCRQWDDLKAGYYKHYRKAYFPTQVPKWLMNTVAKIYRSRYPNRH
ncbi:serine/threonine protein kinase [Geomicrobium sp. JCM 19037]|uniref:serine/threonine protein kinase n=1 Tax=Geomicrobium sp. JCM 19037 TaxID=1460634 RepID=UPI00045F2E28|nr:serine/threonine protein kinase [Geomicrobium sp. JCM 19037]GAK04450.1 serine/threonine protein kinase [Geomicrobium sp. JCM 19037]